MNQADRAAEAMRVYLGASGKVLVRDEQRLFVRVSRLIQALAKKSGLSESNVWDQVVNEARRRGVVTPRPGQHI